MLAAGLVEESGESDDQRRKYYRITRAGRRAVRSEAQRLAAAVATARAKRVLDAEGAA
jgi:DNA-binding PadR family transcriptional regulator